MATRSPAEGSPGGGPRIACWRPRAGDGESIRELVQTQTGQSAAANASAVSTSAFMSSELGTFYRSAVNAGPHVLLATNRNLYAMKPSGGRLLDVGDVVLKAPSRQGRPLPRKEDADLRRHQVSRRGAVRRARRPPVPLRQQSGGGTESKPAPSSLSQCAKPSTPPPRCNRRLIRV